MLIYRKGTPGPLLFRLAGSAIPKACIYGGFSALLTLILDVIIHSDKNNEGYIDSLFQHPYAFQPFAYIAAFVLVFRTNVAYNRYWEMAGHVTLMGSKWGDALVEALAFDEVPRGKPEDFVATLARRRHFQALMIRRFSLILALALQYLRRDDSLDNLSGAKGTASSSVEMGLGAFGGMHGPDSRTEVRWQLLEVLGGLAPSELTKLAQAQDRVGFIYTTIINLGVHRRFDGGLGVDAPVLSRYYQLISDGMLGFRCARKIEDIPFPWPYTQAVEAFLLMFTIIFPLVLSRFAGEGLTSIWIGPFLAFVTVTSYTTLHKVAPPTAFQAPGPEPCPPKSQPGLEPQLLSLVMIISQALRHTK